MTWLNTYNKKNFLFKEIDLKTNDSFYLNNFKITKKLKKKIQKKDLKKYCINLSRKIFKKKYYK